MPTDKLDMKTKAALELRRAIGKSKNYGVGWLARGDDEVIQACKEFDLAWNTATKSEKAAKGEG